jgi:hypothetical protein
MAGRPQSSEPGGRRSCRLVGGRVLTVPSSAVEVPVSLLVGSSGSTSQCRAAAERGGSFLESCHAHNGAVLEPVADPLVVLRGGAQLSAGAVFHTAGGADVWHTVHAVAAYARLGRRHQSAEPFVEQSLLSDGGLCYWSARVGLCVETTSAAALAMPHIRRNLRAVLRRHALPQGRWSNYILDDVGGYARYAVGPSVTGWALCALPPSDPRRNAGSAYLREALGQRHVWAADPAFYGTPFYAAHVAARILPDPRVLEYTLATQDSSGGWGFGDPPGPPSALPTALALLTLDCFSDQRIALARERGQRWLCEAQRHDGSFGLDYMPAEIWFAATVYATAVAVLALTHGPADSRRVAFEVRP